MRWVPIKGDGRQIITILRLEGSLESHLKFSAPESLIVSWLHAVCPKQTRKHLDHCTLCPGRTIVGILSMAGYMPIHG